MRITLKLTGGSSKEAAKPGSVFYDHEKNTLVFHRLKGDFTTVPLDDHDFTLHSEVGPLKSTDAGTYVPPPAEARGFFINESILSGSTLDFFKAQPPTHDELVAERDITLTPKQLVDLVDAAREVNDD